MSTSAAPARHLLLRDVRLAGDLERQPLGGAAQGGVAGADLDPRDRLTAEGNVDDLGRDQEAQGLVGILGR